MTFDEAFDRLLGFEGDYVNDSRDPGGATRWGVTQRMALKAGYTGDMRTLPRDFAKGLYRQLFWDRCQCDELPESVRYAVFDAAVNSGVAQSIQWLQKALNVAADGLMGPATLAAAKSADASLLSKICAARLKFLTSLPTFAAFGKGWVRRVAEILS